MFLLFDLAELLLNGSKDLVWICFGQSGLVFMVITSLLVLTVMCRVICLAIAVLSMSLFEIIFVSQVQRVCVTLAGGCWVQVGPACFSKSVFLF